MILLIIFLRSLFLRLMIWSNFSWNLIGCVWYLVSSSAVLQRGGTDPQSVTKRCSRASPQRFSWRHMGLSNPTVSPYLYDGVQLHSRGKYSLYRSIRVANPLLWPSYLRFSDYITSVCSGNLSPRCSKLVYVGGLVALSYFIIDTLLLMFT